MQVHAQVRTWNLANKWNQEFRDDRDFDFFFLKSVPNDLPSLGNGQEKTIYVSFSARCNRPKTGLLNITEPAPVDGANEASISGDENNASSTNNASCASVRASNKILIYLFLAGCKQNSSANTLKNIGSVQCGLSYICLFYKYVQAICEFNIILLYIFTTKVYYQKSPQYERILKRNKNEQNACVAFVSRSGICPQSKCKRYDDEAFDVYDELFPYACHKKLFPKTLFKSTVKCRFALNGTRIELKFPEAMSTSYLPATTDSIAQALEAKDTSGAISILYRVLDDPSSSPEALRMKEQAITNLTDLLRQENRGEDLRSLLTSLRPFFSLIPKAKTAKIVRGIIDSVAKIPGTSDLQISLCKEMVQWTRAEKRTFLRQRIEARLAALLMETKEYSEALTLLSGLVKEVRRLDDKLLLVDIDLLESKLHFSLRNLPKAKAALTAARTAANAIYVPPAQQGAIDLQSGILHAEEKDYKTAYSYFFEAFESFNALEDPKAIFSLKYMLLCKIMVNQADDVGGIISSKAGLQYVGPDLDAMKAVADAYSKRSLKFFETALQDYKAQLGEDPIVHRHISSLYDTLLEQNLCRLIEPFSRVEIAHIAELIELPIDHVERKMSQMILDKKFAGTLDQGAGCLVIFDDPKTDAIYPATLETISNVGKVVDSLYVRSAKIMA
ncbi:26S proteasome non-ATPase regulatory subunit-like protein [Medicago truncatula]|uniref:26S proteasome non-ATPase regulatory subunit-like protein n=3 Tax=Medicago truncatula TaxID=3880 RepID=G7J2W0_MEDTR|nr:26S proteasome non-ATPase regulatory subunit-like protein [Medicago truncatula]